MKTPEIFSSSVKLRPDIIRGAVARQMTRDFYLTILLAILSYVMTVLLLILLVSFVIDLNIAWPQVFAGTLLSLVAMPVIAFAAPFWSLHHIVVGLFDASVSALAGVKVLGILIGTGLFLSYLARVPVSLVLRIYLSLLFCLSSAIVIGWIAGT